MTQEHVLELKKVNNMTNEEKAKAYDKAIEKARGMYKEGLWNARIEYIFPELKESEDEEIRKWLINEIKIKHHNLDENKVDFVDKAIAWLEKQGEQKKIIIDIDKMVDNFARTEAKTTIKIDAYRKGVEDAINLSLNLIKQGEQKPIDKVEPKFKVGDWVVNKQGEIAQINHIKEDYYGTQRYYIEFTNGVKSDPMPCFADEAFHLWTIEEAKDGDVLVNNNIMCIYKNRKSNHLIKVYLTHSLAEGVEITDDTIGDFYLHPATKEQRELLFTKMKEAGYEWDDNKKVLRMIRQQ